MFAYVIKDNVYIQCYMCVMFDGGGSGGSGGDCDVQKQSISFFFTFLLCLIFFFFVSVILCYHIKKNNRNEKKRRWKKPLNFFYCCWLTCEENLKNLDQWWSTHTHTEQTNQINHHHQLRNKYKWILFPNSNYTYFISEMKWNTCCIATTATTTTKNFLRVLNIRVGGKC